MYLRLDLCLYLIWSGVNVCIVSYASAFVAWFSSGTFVRVWLIGRLLVSRRCTRRRSRMSKAGRRSFGKRQCNVRIMGFTLFRSCAGSLVRGF